MLKLDGVSNFRDLGGLPAADGRRLRPRVLLRSERLCDLTTGDWAQLAGLPLTTICDLRSVAERDRHPNSVPAAMSARALDFDIRNDLRADPGLIAMLRQSPDAAGAAEVMTEIYRRLPRNLASALGQICASLSEGGAPMLIHCAAGKDRTGFAVAVLLRLLGVPTEAVEADYLASRGWPGAHRHRAPLARRLALSIDSASMDGVIDAVLDVRNGYLGAAFSTIDREYGSFERYCEQAVGLSGERRARLRDTLLE